MSDQELAQAMRDLIARQGTGLQDARQLSADVMRRDSSRIRLLTITSVFFWLLAATGLLFLTFSVYRLVVWSPVVFLAALIVSVLLAALFTILHEVSSRRATLRQINISLMEISEQVKQLRRPMEPERKPPGG
jgi:fatty acid desaturase